MKRLVFLFLLILFVLPGCSRKQTIQIPLPSAPPDPATMQPVGSPSS